MGSVIAGNGLLRISYESVGGFNLKNRVMWIRLLSLAWPVIMENFLQSTAGFVDSLFISKLGLTEVAAVGVTNAILQIYFALFMSISTATTVFVSRAIGENDEEKVRNIVSQSVLLSVLMGLLLGAVSLFFARPILSLMGANQEVLQVGVRYFQIVAVPSVVISLLFTIGAILRGSGDTKTPLRIGLWMNIVHIILDYILIIGVFFHGFGIEGAAAATVLARLIGVSLLSRHLHKSGLLFRSIRKWSTIHGELFQKLVLLGVPAALERLFMRTGQLIYFGMIIRMGTKEYAAHTLTGNFTMFSTIVGTGLAVATTTLIGQSLGAGRTDEVKSYSKWAMIISSAVMSITLLFVWGTSFWATHFFTTDQFVIHLMITVLLIDVIAQPATGMVTALTAILQAGGDTKFPMYVTWLGIWGVRTVGVYVLGISLGWGLIGAWIAIALDNYIRAAILFSRYRSFKWLKKI